MDFVPEVTDLGAPEIAITGIASIERISAGQVRVSYYSMRKDGAIVVAHMVWDLQAWLRLGAIEDQARDIIGRMAPPDGPDQERRREKH